MKKTISIFLIIIMALTTILSYPLNSYALTMYRTVTKYHLDMGALHIWGTGTDKYNATWQNGYAYGGSMPSTVTLSFNEDIQSAKAYVLDADTFQWSNNPTYSFNGTDYLTDGKSYNDNYDKYVSKSISVNKPIVNGKKVTLSYTASLKSNEDFDLASYLKVKDIGMKYVFDMLGGKDIVEQYYPDLHQRLIEGNGNIGNGVLGYMFFVPIVIEYTVLEPYTLNPGDFTADLDVPTSAKPGDTFNVVDKSAFYDTSEFACTQLSYKVDSGSPKTVTGWKGTSLGESIPQSFTNECSVTYTITTWNEYGDSKTASKTVNISDEHAIEINPVLELPDHTYEGHKEIAKDQSTFVVDGVDRSATYVYAEGLASNSFKADSGTVSIHEVDSTRAECTFSQRGTYDITLNIRADGGGRASTNDSIEVRKTPYIEDSLTGFQKQNRKQILTATVATYPGKPLMDYSITLKDKVTGELVVLTPENPQQNTSMIKTRSVTMTQDLEKGFTYLTVEFLTKTPAYNSADPGYTQDFYYEINVEDSKGDTDTASKTFTVTPDIPPTAAVSLDTAFLRNEGTNIASIKAEDVTVAADGDSVERTWYYAPGTAPSIFTTIASMDGYKKLSFGTDKIVGFDRAGVGKLTVKLDVKEVWTEPTLEEYVTDADHLTGSIRAYSDVLNVAPIVSLELLNATQKDVLLIANNDSEYQTLLNNKTTLKQALLANKIDADIVIKKLIGNSSDSTITSKLSYNLPTTIWKSGQETDRNIMTTDSERAYLTTWTMVGTTGYTTPVTVHAYSPYSGEVWSYTSSDGERFSFGQDDIGKYLYLIYSTQNKTIMLDKKTGAVAGTISTALPSKVILTDNVFFTNENGVLYARDQNTLIKTQIDTNVSSVARVGRSLQYVTITESGVIKNTLDLSNLSITKELVVDLTNGGARNTNYRAVVIDDTGKIVLYKTKGTGSDIFNGIRVYDANNNFLKEIATPESSGDVGFKDAYAPIDESGESHHIIVYREDGDSDPNRHYFTGVNLDTGTANTLTVKSDALNSMNFGNCFESNGSSYFYGAGWYLNGGTDYWGPTYRITYNGTTVSSSTTGVGMIGTYDEDYSSSDRIISSWWGNNSTGVLKYQISAIPKTLIQETKEIIAKFSDKFTFVGGVTTTADQIKSTIGVPQPLVKLVATKDTNMTLNNLTLLSGKKYYYDYELKPLADGTKDRLTGISATTGSTSSTQSFLADTLYVTDSYSEDFNGNSINPYFTVENNGLFANGGFGAYYDDDSSMKLSFVVPNGKQAIVTMDMSMYFTNRGYDALSNNQYRTAIEYDNTNVFVDGNTIRDLDTMNNNSGSYYIDNSVGAVYYKILEAGTHSVECRGGANNWNYVLIDNLRVDILSTSPKTLSSTFNANEGEQEDWLSINGSFETPNKVISYGAQASTTYYGAISSAVTEIRNYHDREYPEEITYYQTVPAGYIQKARVYFSGSVGSGDEVGFTPYNCGKFRFEERSSYSGTLGIGEWRSIGPLTAGTYSHLVETQDYTYSTGRMDTFDIVQYPYNAVTATGNIAFNSTNTKYFFPKVNSNGSTNLTMFVPKGEYYVKNLRIYYIENGQKVYLQNKALADITQLPNWTLSSGLTASNVSIEEEEKEDDEFVKIYKKGEKVLYNIFYDDYEKDPSKTGYWVYTHINWPPDTVHPDVGKILTAPIDRFYLSGKYTVTHWEVDNTQRTGTVGDSTPYNKDSNKVTMTFYVDGEGKAPWVTHIKTNPATVKENNNYTLAVGVDDSEKDTLTLETEVYLNGKSIFIHKKENITVDANGGYPETLINGLPTAKAGVYQVICTVADYSGVGIEAYKFIVVSEGKITGSVYHTSSWETNRKKFNLSWFSSEVNMPYTYAEYTALPSPRRRGTNVFWSGEKFTLNAAVAGSPTSVSCTINGYSYSTTLTSTGVKNAENETIYTGTLWNNSMINKWGATIPQSLTFTFTANYAGTDKQSSYIVIVDDKIKYWQLHRAF